MFKRVFLKTLSQPVELGFRDVALNNLNGHIGCLRGENEVPRFTENFIERRH